MRGERGVRNNLHESGFAVWAEHDAVALVETVCYNAYVTRVGVEAVHLVLQQGWLTEPLKEAISVLNR